MGPWTADFRTSWFSTHALLTCQAPAQVWHDIQSSSLLSSVTILTRLPSLLMTLTIWRSTIQGFCRISLSMGCPAAFSVDRGHGLWKNPAEVNRTSTLLTVGEVDSTVMEVVRPGSSLWSHYLLPFTLPFIRVIKGSPTQGASVRSSHWLKSVRNLKTCVIITKVFNKYWGERYLRPCRHSASPFSPAHWFWHHWFILPAAIITVVSHGHVLFPSFFCRSICLNLFIYLVIN